MKWLLIALMAVIMTACAFGEKEKSAAELRKDLDNLKTNIESQVDKAKEEYKILYHDNMDLLSDKYRSFNSLKSRYEYEIDTIYPEMLDKIENDKYTKEQKNKVYNYLNDMIKGIKEYFKYEIIYIDSSYEQMTNDRNIKKTLKKGEELYKIRQEIDGFLK